MNRILQFLFLIILFSFSNPLLIFAQTEENYISVPKIEPGDFLYSVKRFWEKTEEKLLFSDSVKSSFYQRLSNERFKELKYLVDNRRVDQIEKSSYRFSYESGRLSEYVISKKSCKRKYSYPFF